MSLVEEVQEMARLREKRILDESSALGNAMKTGMRGGLAEAAQKMSQSGMAEEQIHQILDCK